MSFHVPAEMYSLFCNGDFSVSAWAAAICREVVRRMLCVAIGWFLSHVGSTTSGGMSRGDGGKVSNLPMGSNSSIPVLAIVSALSLPGTFECPFTHCAVIFSLNLAACQYFLSVHIISVCVIGIVSPCMASSTYLESRLILMGISGGYFSR